MTLGVCDDSSYDLQQLSSSLEDASVSGCQKFCERNAAEYGEGCCQRGGCVAVWNGYNCGLGLCSFYVGGKVKEYNSDKGYTTAMCAVGNEADEATSFFALTSDEHALTMAVNFCAAVGFASVLYGAYKFYFGAKN